VYNTTIKKFPSNLFAGVFGFREQPNVSAPQAAQEAPKLGTGKF
jgi:LemA protein